MRLLSIHFEHLSTLWRLRQRPYDGDVYYYIGKRLQLERETENVRMRRLHEKTKTWVSLLPFFVLLCVCPEVTVTSLHPPRICRLAVFSIKPTLLSLFVF